MNAEQVATVLAKVQLGDNRDVDALVLEEWIDTIGDLHFDDAIAAVRMHRKESTEYLTVAHIRRNVRRVRDEQERAERVVRARQFKAIAPPVMPDRAELELVYQSSLRESRIARGKDPETGL